jgi:regulator of CtrA degradation
MTLHPSLFPVPDDSFESKNIIMMPSLLRETMELIFESYEFFELHDTMEDHFIPPHISNLTNNEMSRVTMRLTSIMAWLLARKAIASGQLQSSEVSNYTLEGQEQCLASNDFLEGLLPEYLTSLLQRSHALYQRVWRLDQQSGPAQLELHIS